MHKRFKTGTNTNTPHKTTNHTYDYTQTNITKQEGKHQTNRETQNNSDTIKATETEQTDKTKNMLKIVQAKTNNNTREENTHTKAVETLNKTKQQTHITQKTHAQNI